MKTFYTHSWKLLVCLIILFIQVNTEAYASHAQGGNLTYTCLGGNQYRLRLAFYRDCSGTTAPGNVQIDVSSASTNSSFSVTLNPIAGTGQDVTPICPQLLTVCNGGSNPGVQEWIYEGVVTLPQAATDWIFGFNFCCRNAAINTIVAPGSQNMYIESYLNNVAAPGNSSPTFSNIPVPFICSGQSYCFNHGAVDPDGDSLAYSMVAPETGPGTYVTYISPYTASQPLLSNPAVSFNPLTGDICMNPTQIIVTVMAVRVEEWRNGVMIGSVVRDIQLHTISCTNNLPYITGINNTNSYSLTSCAGAPISFYVNSFDVDAGQNVTMTWNGAIAGAQFVTSNSSTPTGTFTWTPGPANISNTPYCFTITVTDDACPYSGSQTFAFCITVTGFGINLTSSSANCNASNGSASVTVNGGNGPYTYQWSSGGNNSTANGLNAGTYSVTVTDAVGCVAVDSVTVAQGAAPGNVQTSVVDIACYGNTNGSATVNVNGGQQPYTYAWSNGGNTPTINNLSAGTYSILVTTANGCQTSATVTITQPASAVSSTASVTNHVSCFGGNNATASAVANGGVGPYAYSWNSTPAQNTPVANGLIAGTYAVVVTDANGCTSTSNVTITQPPALNTPVTATAVSCNGGTNGSAHVTVSGGVSPYGINWNSTPAQFTPTAINLPAGNYTATVTDANGCIASPAVAVTQPAPLSITMNIVNNALCNGSSNGTAAVSVSGGTTPYSYNWNTSPVQTTANATSLAAGNYTATITDANGCATVSTVTITQPTPVTIAVSASDTVCPGQPVVISANANGGSGNYTFNWNPALGPNSAYTVFPSSPSTYTVNAVDDFGCTSGTSTIFIDVYQFNPGDMTVAPNTSICAGSTAQVWASVIGNTGPINYVWTNQPWNTGGPYTVTPTTTTSYIVTATNGCSVAVTNTITVVVNAIPQPVVLPQSATGCDGVTMVFADTVGGNSNCTYAWDFGDSNTGTGNNASHEYGQSGIYNITLIATSPAGCSGIVNTQANITVYDSPHAEFEVSNQQVSELEPTIIFQDESSPNTIGWQWDFGDNTTATSPNPVHTYTATGNYNVRLIATSFGGCTDTTDEAILVNPEFTLYVPNAFTPNDDGKNDVFYAYGNEITAFHMEIFDRWGNLIFVSDDINNGWNGHAHNGSDVAQQDVYVYKIAATDFSGKKHVYDGHVSLMK